MQLSEFPLYIVEQGWLSGARRSPSSNQDARPDLTIDLLVVHGISLPPDIFGGGWVEDLFLNRLDTSQHPYFAQIAGLEVSAHLFIRRSGEIVQFVPFDRRAWHAGASSFQGRSRCNDFSIGIELEGADEIPYEPIQYTQLTAVAVALMRAYPAIVPEHIVGHCDIAPGRKTDPGAAFDWAAFRAQLHNHWEIKP